MTPSLTQALGLFFQAHPWHGVTPGEKAPGIVTWVPTDAVKYEVDKASGILKLDRPQRYSNQPPCLYGFIPRTYCDTRVGERCAQRSVMSSPIRVKASSPRLSISGGITVTSTRGML